MPGHLLQGQRLTEVVLHVANGPGKQFRVRRPPLGKRIFPDESAHRPIKQCFFIEPTALLKGKGDLLSYEAD